MPEANNDGTAVGSRPRAAHRFVAFARLIVALACAFGLTPAQANEPPWRHRGSTVVDVDTGAVLHAWNANRRLYPASLTKLMTVHLVLDALEDGRVGAQAAWPVSPKAARQPATKMHLRAGRRIPVTTLLDGLMVVSANDAAMAAAEGLMGGEDEFVARMNTRAKALGMARTRFQNPSGLPHPSQLTTARDVAVLSVDLWRRFPHRAALFGQRSVRHGKRALPTINGFLTSYTGATGMKTGFTCRAGFNLVASAERKGRRLIGVVLGAPTPNVRASDIRKLLDDAFALGVESPTTQQSALTLDGLASLDGQGDRLPVSAQIIAERCLTGARAAPRDWTIDLGARHTAAEARRAARNFIGPRRAQLPRAKVATMARWIGVQLHRVLVTGLSKDVAIGVCLSFRAEGGDCVVLTPQVIKHQAADAVRVKKLQRLARDAARQSN